MQVFLPYPSFRDSLLTLDKSRLGNQVWREAKTLITGGWSNHPASKLWSPYKPALAQYCLTGLDILEERNWINYNKYANLYYFFQQYLTSHFLLPHFIGDTNFHLSHRLNLLYKLPQHYSKYFNEPIPREKPDYLWPLAQS